MRDRRVSVADEVVDPVGAVSGGVQHATNHPVGIQGPLLDQTIQHLLDLRPEPDEHGIPQLLDLRREVLQQILPQQGVLGHVGRATVIVFLDEYRIAQEGGGLHQVVRRGEQVGRIAQTEPLVKAPMVELVDQVAPQRLSTERADALGGLDRFRAGLAGLKRAPRLVVGIDHLSGARRDPDQNDPRTGVDVLERRVIDLHVAT